MCFILTLLYSVLNIKVQLDTIQMRPALQVHFEMDFEFPENTNQQFQKSQIIQTRQKQRHLYSSISFIFHLSYFGYFSYPYGFKIYHSKYFLRKHFKTEMFLK